MSNKGCLIAAINSTTSDGKLLDYCSLAKVSAKFVKKYLNLPTTFITSQPENFDATDDLIVVKTPDASTRTMIYNDDNISYKWFNDVRISAFTVSPYDRTLMIDADYIVKTDYLNTWIESDLPFHIFDNAYDITGRGIYNQKYLTNKSIKQTWATAIVWDKNAKHIFEAAKMVRDNYEYYSILTGMPYRPFRNDVAFSIACHLINYKINEFECTLNNLPPDSKLLNVSDKSFKVISKTISPLVTMWHNDIHVINKDIAIDKEIIDKLNQYVETV